MNIENHISALTKLGLYISEEIEKSSEEFQQICFKAAGQNPWFTIENSKIALYNISKSLQKEFLELWLSKYTLKMHNKKVTVIMAGNIPLVGLHDALCVLVTNNHLLAKLSSKDSVLMSYVLQKLIQIEPSYNSRITIIPGIVNQFDAIISTGSNNTSKSFEYYFNKYPHIIRKHRNSVGIITESTSNEELRLIAEDVFQYFGLGCRNISKLYIHENFDITRLCKAFEEFNSISTHNKYMNNYEYIKSIYLLSKIPHYDTGFSLIKEDTSLNSPISVVFYEKFSNFAEIQKNILEYAKSIQCIVYTQDMFFKKNTLPGTTQCPNLWDYADDIDTITFLNNL